MRASTRNNVRIRGTRARPVIFAHGLGCDQAVWRYIAPGFEPDHRVILFDQVGAGGSVLSAYDRDKYSTLSGYADDLLEICRELDLRSVVFVGHSVSAMVGVLAAVKEPQRFERLVLVAPSPRYLHDDGYPSGFARYEIDELLLLLDTNVAEWATILGPAIMGNLERPELAAELTRNFCRTDPEILRHFARVTFLSDNRAELSRLRTPSLILQCDQDVVAPESVGEYMHRHLPCSTLVKMQATGHCPHLSAPQETSTLIREYLRRPLPS
ncbi:MAG: alpha/beta hydrolase [Polyangia bacterium]